MKSFPIPSAPAPSGGEDKPKPQDTKSYAKGGAVESCSYAAGGPVLGRTRDFMKEVDQYRGGPGAKPGAAVGPFTQKDVPQDYGKGSKAHPGKGKSIKTVMPRS